MYTKYNIFGITDHRLFQNLLTVIANRAIITTDEQSVNSKSKINFNFLLTTIEDCATITTDGQYNHQKTLT